MPKQAAVIGMGRFGVSLARELYQMGYDVLAIDKDEQVTQDLTDQLTYVVRSNATSETVLRELGLANYDLAVVAIGTDIQASIMTTLLLKTLGVKEVIARANNALHAQTLDRIGADKVLFPENEAGIRLAHTLFNPNVLEYLEMVPNFGISKVRVPEHAIGRTLEEIGLAGTRDRYGVTVIAIRRGREPVLLPAKDEQVLKGDILFVTGSDELLDRLRRPMKIAETNSKKTPHSRS
jgi:trk system potassium uptake protein TrkA